MSLIYNTLEKIKSDDGGKKPVGRVVAKKKMSDSPVSLVLLAILLSAVMYLVYMGFEHYTKTKTKKNQPTTIYTAPVSQNQYSQTVDDMEESPEIPEYEVIQKTLPESADASATNQYSQTVADVLPEYQVIKNNPSESGDSYGGTFSKAPNKNDSQKETTLTPMPNSEPVNLVENQNAFFENNSKDQSPGVIITKTSNDIKQLNKTTKIINVVAKIKQALLKTNDPKELDGLLSRIKKLKGNKNNYVLKLEAVIHMKSRNYDKAEHILNNITTMKTIDREIEINLAIIELNTSRTSEARKRLFSLNQIYPEDKQILHLLKECNIRR